MTTFVLDARGLTPRMIELLAFAHDCGGASAWGTWTAAGDAAIARGLLRTIGVEHGERGRRTMHYALVDEPEVRDLAERCAYAKRRVDRVRALRPASKVRIYWRHVPIVLPPPRGSSCSVCGCTQDRPCTIQLPGYAGVAHCVRPGLFGLDACSRCWPPATSSPQRSSDRKASRAPRSPLRS